MIKQAVILAAGMGSRLSNQNDQKPKGFLQLGKKSIIEESIDKLIKNGIEKIWIVTGYQSGQFKELIKIYKSTISLIKNEDYAQSGTMHSLSMISEKVSPPFLLLESDIIFEFRAIEMIIGDRSENCILLSGFSDCGDEVFVETSAAKLVSISFIPEFGDMLTRFSGITICSITTGIIWVSQPESLLDVILYDNLHVFFWVCGLYFALRGNRT